MASEVSEVGMGDWYSSYVSMAFVKTKVVVEMVLLAWCFFLCVRCDRTCTVLRVRIVRYGCVAEDRGHL